MDSTEGELDSNNLSLIVTGLHVQSLVEFETYDELEGVDTQSLPVLRAYVLHHSRKSPSLGPSQALALPNERLNAITQARRGLCISTALLTTCTFLHRNVHLAHRHLIT